jgi:hypothetical protein
MDNANSTGATSIESLVAEMIDQLEQRKRNNGTGFWCLKDDAPDWMRDVVHAGHGDYLPNDYSYEYVVNALTTLHDGDMEGESLEPDCYLSDLTSWLASHNDRYTFCDAAVEDGMGFEGTVTLLSWGQLYERRQVFQAVKEALEARLDDA